MAKRSRTVDKTRASRDGHEYHEAWTARKAMQLLQADSDLVGIAVEGLHPADQARASSETVDIADITLYYGRRPTFQQSRKTIIVQFKYSISNKDDDFRASDAKKTIAKFAATYQDYKERYGAKAVHDRLEFELITNRPIYEPLLLAIDAIAKDRPQTGEIKKQADQFKVASGLDGKPLAQFARKCQFFGLSGSLPITKDALATLLVDWSVTKDSLALARLGDLRQMVRDKAGYAGTDRNVIERTDVLAALHIGDLGDLLPCPAALAEIGDVVERRQLADAIALIPKISKPLLIHATGGVGKTVFMNSLASAIGDRYETVFFDCFGGGAYRSLEDSRHLPKNGLVHIANMLSFRGMCDPILPGGEDVDGLLRTFRRRLAQCVETLSRSGRELALFIDAIDNAAMHAHDRSEPAFPVLLLESFHYKPLPGVKLIVSCRTERKPDTRASYEDFELQPFIRDETLAYLQTRLPKLSQAELNVAQARSGGNARILEYLVKSGRGLLDESKINNKIELDDLIQDRISEALSSALERGHKQEDIDAFLAGLGVLPPPVPLDEYASALGIELSAIKSFASDLWPLLERTNQGLMFRDEPTETLVRERYASSHELLRRVAGNLFARQDVSVYAARSLPGLLHILDDGEQLFKLAFDDRIPRSITSTIGRRNIRYARLNAASFHAAIKRDYNRLIQLLLELATIASVDQRGASYILDYPDLVVAARDVDATRRLFETRTSWPGARHARLSIANTLSGDYEEAYRHAVTADEWISHHRRTSSDDRMHEPGPEHLDIVAIPFLLISQGRLEDAAAYMRGYKDWYRFELCEHIFGFSQLVHLCQPKSLCDLGSFIDALTDDIGCLAASMSFQNLDYSRKTFLTTKLVKACRKAKDLGLGKTYHRDRTYELQDGLRKASVIALSMGFGVEALAISLHAPHERPNTWAFRDSFYHHDVFPFIFHTAIVSAVRMTTLHEKDVLPKELVPIRSHIKKEFTGKDYLEKVKEILPKYVRKEQDQSDKDGVKLSYEQKEEAERFLGRRLEPLLELTKALTNLLASPTGKGNVDKAFLDILKAWKDARETRDPYVARGLDRFFQMLGLEIAEFALWARDDLKPSSVEHFLKCLYEQDMYSAHTLIQIVSILAKRQDLQTLAGEQALRARSLIEDENDVTYRASLYASLARAILPASTDEASAYFRAGIEQMDAIGSGDIEFTNELLIFASSIKGDELDERDFHTLTNICELNMGEESEKFPWGAFAGGLSKAAGPRGLAKLSRWDDRSRISLSHTLQPYLTALVDDGKIEAEDALALNRLVDPVEYFDSGTETFATAIYNKGGRNKSELITELISQFEDNNPGVSRASTVKAFASLAEEVFGSSSETVAYLSAAHKRFAIVREARNEHMNYRGRSDTQLSNQADDRDRETRKALKQIVADTSPTDEESLEAAIAAVNAHRHAFDLRGEFFVALRDKLSFSERAQYIRLISELQNLDIYGKLAELKTCRENWGQSSASLEEVYRKLAIPLIQFHADDLVSFGRFSGHKLKEISDLTGVAIPELVLELIKLFARPDTSVPGAVWLALASFICPEAAEGQGQAALKRLLGSDATRLSASVIDGEWEEGLYPENGVQAIAAGLVWRILGSPYAVDRWRAAHSIRCFARFGRWGVVDALVSKLAQEDAGPFQAKELSFLCMHARLWLLIALARIALDYPKNIACYQAELLCIGNEDKEPHVLMRHFATKALLACIDAGAVEVPANVAKRLRNIDRSPHPRLKEKTGKGGGFYEKRPDTARELRFEFNLDYDFDKYDVQKLGSIFGKPGWEVRDLISDIVHRFDPNVSSMYESGGREYPDRNNPGMTTRFHTYSQQLGWHALFLVAGRFLRDCPVTNDSWHENDPWGEWLSRYLLTRDDGLWLSDGMDRTPLNVAEILLEEANDDLALTGNQEKILKLAGLRSRISGELVVDGTWFSSDNIRVNIASSLVAPSKSARLARELIREEPMLVWLPRYDEYDGVPVYLRRSEKKHYKPWIVCPSGEARLDEHDPFGAPCANRRPRLAASFCSELGLTTDDPFGRVWRNKRGHVAIRAEAWGREDRYSEEGQGSGSRLLCAAWTLKRILNKNNKDMLLLITLQRYEKETYPRESRFTHTVAVARITKTLELEYFKGLINHIHQSRN